ncbi:MAG: hypothetical protein ACOX6Q_02645 [Candidatus Dojkabacteria bacterium]|jgi:thymidylate kinase
MPIESYGSVCVEGGDQVGKADATLELLAELEREKINVTYCSFPIYAAPIGTTIRCLLNEGYPEDTSVSNNDLEVRCALFALNRLEFLDVYLSDKKYADTMLLFDRSPFSNAVTIGYGAANIENFDDEKMKEYVELALDLDSLMISKLGLERSIVQLKSERKEWSNMREKEGDQYEREDVQKRCEQVYDIYRDVVGDGWHQVITRDEDGWRSREEILGNICNILKDTYGDMEDIRRGKKMSIGFKDIVEKMYSGSVYSNDVFTKYDSALKRNYKDEMYVNGVMLGKAVASSCKSINFSNEEVRGEFRRIIKKLPEILNVFEYFLGKNYVDNLTKALEL